MPRNPEQDRSTVIAQALSRGMSTSQISGVMGVSKRTVTRVSSNLKKHGSPRAPPSGAKQGRPAKVTRSQAQALLSWITAKDYVFYVKDLVEFLKTNHGYKGCDGTIRRALIRAGFRRKEPFRKSEMTHWVPPSHPVNFIVITEDHGDDDSTPPAQEDPIAQQQPPAQDPTSPAQANMTSPDPMQMLSTHAVPTFQSPPQSLQGMDPLNVAQLQAASHMQLDPQNGQDFRLDPALRSMHPPLAVPDQVQGQGQTNPPRHVQDPAANMQPAPRSQHPAPATPVTSQAHSTPASGKKKKQPPHPDDQLRQQVDTLQSQLAQQTELIKNLQTQLMQSQGMSMSHQMAQAAPAAHYPAQGRQA